MSEEQKKPGVGFWVTVVAVCLLSYPLSFGPVCWIDERQDRREANPVVQFVYRPIISAASDNYRAPSRAIRWYASLLVRKYHRKAEFQQGKLFWEYFDTLN